MKALPNLPKGKMRDSISAELHSLINDNDPASNEALILILKSARHHFSDLRHKVEEFRGLRRPGPHEVSKLISSADEVISFMESVMKEHDIEFNSRIHY
jgi:hypothetical protein